MPKETDDNAGLSPDTCDPHLPSMDFYGNLRYALPAFADSYAWRHEFQDWSRKKVYLNLFVKKVLEIKITIGGCDPMCCFCPRVGLFKGKTGGDAQCQGRTFTNPDTCIFPERLFVMENITTGRRPPEFCRFRGPLPDRYLDILDHLSAKCGVM